jgi:hypothetical protein
LGGAGARAKKRKSAALLSTAQPVNFRPSEISGRGF